MLSRFFIFLLSENIFIFCLQVTRDEQDAITDSDNLNCGQKYNAVWEIDGCKCGLYKAETFLSFEGTSAKCNNAANLGCLVTFTNSTRLLVTPNSKYELKIDRTCSVEQVFNWDLDIKRGKGTWMHITANYGKIFQVQGTILHIYIIGTEWHGHLFMVNFKCNTSPPPNCLIFKIKGRVDYVIPSIEKTTYHYTHQIKSTHISASYSTSIIKPSKTQWTQISSLALSYFLISHSKHKSFASVPHAVSSQVQIYSSYSSKHNTLMTTTKSIRETQSITILIAATASVKAATSTTTVETSAKTITTVGTATPAETTMATTTVKTTASTDTTVATTTVETTASTDTTMATTTVETTASTDTTMATTTVETTASTDTTMATTTAETTASTDTTMATTTAETTASTDPTMATTTVETTASTDPTMTTSTVKTTASPAETSAIIMVATTASHVVTSAITTGSKPTTNITISTSLIKRKLALIISIPTSLVICICLLGIVLYIRSRKKICGLKKTNQVEPNLIEDEKDGTEGNITMKILVTGDT